MQTERLTHTHTHTPFFPHRTCLSSLCPLSNGLAFIPLLMLKKPRIMVSHFLLSHSQPIHQQMLQAPKSKCVPSHSVVQTTIISNLTLARTRTSSPPPTLSFSRMLSSGKPRVWRTSPCLQKLPPSPQLAAVPCVFHALQSSCPPPCPIMPTSSCCVCFQ